MDVTTTNAATQSASTASAAAAESSSSVISADFEMFLQMLTVQMQNQDPLNPIESSDYAVQLATFSGVEQQVQTNDLLASLSSQITANGMADMAGWVGMEARAAVPAHFDGTNGITLAPNPVAIADSVELVVFDQWGTEVDRAEIPVSTDNYEWTGTDSDGTPLPSGTYSFQLASYSDGEFISQDPVEVYSLVQEIRSDGSGALLLIEGGAEIPAASITALRDPSLF